MPPTFRSSRSGRQLGDGVNRTRTGQIDHDVFEGLPVRRWTRQVQTVSQEPKTDVAESEAPGQGQKQSIPEHPMPRDSHLLAPMSRALLRAARSGCIYIRQASKDIDDEDKEAIDPEEQQVLQNTERNFSMRKWATVPKHLEPPEVEFLAKRRPGLPSLYGATAGIVEGSNGSVPMRKTRFKKVDPVTGNISIYAAWVPEGHKIEGEVTDDAQLAANNSKVTVTPQAPAPGTVIEGVGVVNSQGVVVAEAGSAAVLTPQRRRPPPPKRKGKGLKGRRKKVMFAPGEGVDASLVHGAGAGSGDNAAGYGKDTDSSRMSVDQTTQDDDDDDGEEGEESDDGEGEESGFDAKTPETPGPQPSTEPESKPTPGPEAEPIIAPVATVQAPETSLALGSVQAAVPPFEGVAADAASSIITDNPSKGVAAPAPALEDIQMTDTVPTDAALPPPVPATNAQLTISEIAQPVQNEKPLSLPHVDHALAPGTTNVSTGLAGNAVIVQPSESQDIIMAESTGPDPENVQAETASLEISAAAPQATQVKTQDISPAPEQIESQQSANEFDLLDNLEASLNNLPKETARERQQVVPDQRPHDHNQEGAVESEPIVPSQPPTEAATKAQIPPHEETVPATLPEPEQQQPSIVPSSWQPSPPTLPEQQRLHQPSERISETPTLPQSPLPASQTPIESSQQTTAEQPSVSSLEPTPARAPSEAPAPSVPAAEPPKAEESLPAPAPVGPVTEKPQALETSSEAAAPTVVTEQLEGNAPIEMDPTTSIQPVSEAQSPKPSPSLIPSPPVPSGVVEPAAEPSHEERHSDAELVQRQEVQEPSTDLSFAEEEEAKS
ncbi:hypothetical protein BJX64DRAFT_249852 [Aspergillus heterothallicus]